MWLGVTRSYEPRWSDAIFEEWSRNLLLNRPDLRPEQLEYTYTGSKVLERTFSGTGR